MSLLKLKIDVSGTVGDAAWQQIQQFEQIVSADFGPQFGSRRTLQSCRERAAWQRRVDWG